jgi:hypothetical protein
MASKAAEEGKSSERRSCQRGLLKFGDREQDTDMGQTLWWALSCQASERLYSYNTYTST